MDNIVDKQQMESLKALSDINLKVSEAKNLLFSLQEQETEYLIIRERKATDRIQKTIDDSKEMVQEADKNHIQVKEFLTEVSQFVDKLLKIQDDFKGLYTEFENRNVEWERDIGKQQDDIAEIRKQIKVERIQIENEQENIGAAKKKLSDDQKKLDSDRGTLERAINRLKEKRI